MTTDESESESVVFYDQSNKHGDVCINVAGVEGLKVNRRPPCTPNFPLPAVVGGGGALHIFPHKALKDLKGQ